MFSNKSICSPEDREAIAVIYNRLATAIKDGLLKTPIIFTSVGSRPRLGIVPELTDGLATKTNIDWDEVARRLDAQYLQSEFMVEPTQVPEPEEPEPIQLSQLATTVLEIIKAATKYPIGFDSIRKSRRWTTQPERTLLRTALQELVDFQVIVGNEWGGYSPKSNFGNK